MGVDLKLLPFYSAYAENDFSHDVLSMERNSILFDKIEELANQFGRDVPETFTSYLGRQENGDSCYGLTLETDYGDNLKWIYVSDFLKVNHQDVMGKNKGIFSFLKELPPKTKIALFWC